MSALLLASKGYTCYCGVTLKLFITVPLSYTHKARVVFVQQLQYAYFFIRQLSLKRH